MRFKGSIARSPLAGLVAPQFSGDRRWRTADPAGDFTDTGAFAVQLGDLDAFVLGEVTSADLADLEAVQRLNEPNR